MVTKKPKGLGRGLEALLGPKVADKAPASANAAGAADGPVSTLPPGPAPGRRPSIT